MAEQFEVTQQEVAYQPEQATDFVREFDRHIAERDAMARPYEASLRNRAQQGVEDANKQVREMEQLAKLSNSLMSKLTDIQKNANDEQYAQGLADALMEDPDLMGQADLEIEEQKLVAGQEVATQTSKQYLAEGGSKANSREIRNTGGWYGYGKFVGQLQLLGDGYGSALEEAKGDFKININGQELGYDQLSSKDEYNTWQRAFNAQYLRGVPKTNGDVVEKYVLKEMRAQSKSARAVWTKEFNEQREAEEKEGRQISLINDINRGDTTIAEKAFATYPGSFREIRDELEDNLITGIDSGMITTDEALNFYETQTVIKDGKRQTMAEAFPLQYALFQDEVAKAQTKEDNEWVANQTSEARELQRTLAGGPPLSNQEAATLMNSSKFRDNPSAIQILQNHITKEEGDDIGDEAYLNAMYESGELTPQVLSRFSKRMQDKFASKAEQTATIQSEFDDKEATRMADSAARLIQDYSQGEVTNKDDFGYQRIFRNAKALYKEAYSDARMRGADHEKASKYARDTVEAEANKNDTVLDDKQQPVTLPSKVKETTQYIQQHKNAINTEVLPNTEKELEQAVRFLRTGRGSMPGFYSALAQGQLYTAEELVLRQASLAGIDVKDLQQTKALQDKRKLRPELQRLLSVAPNTQTVAQAATRAVLGGDDTKFILDSIASQESSGYGHYDAYNLGGSNGGHTAHGSGNSAEDGHFGKPVSQLTIGEIKRLHAQGKAHAMGRYQFIASTFAETARRTGLPDDTVFDAKTQDTFALTRLIQRASWGNLQTGLKSEWIGLNYLGSANYQRLVQAANNYVRENK